MMQPTPAPSSPPSSPTPAVRVIVPEAPTVYPAPPQNRGSAPFHVLVALFDKLQSERKPERRRRMIATWFNHWREEKGYDLYPVLRLILPQKDRERAVYGLKEKNLAKIYIKSIPLGMKDPDALRLLNWKKPNDKFLSSGDFPAILYEVVSKRSSVIEGSLTIDTLNDLLDELSQHTGKQDAQSKILQRVYNRTTPEEQRWIVRIILKDMTISVKETTVLSVFHADAQDLFNTCSDLKKVAWELWDPNRHLDAEDKTIQLFRAFAPMLCKRPTRKIEESVKEMQGRKFIIEEKLDGERVLLHKRGNEYFYCSRKGKDYTYLYGKHVGAGSLTPYIDSAFDPRIDELILDGEMLVWDPVSERNLPFGHLKTAALDKSKKENNPRPCLKIFDLLHLNGMSLLQKPLKFRKRNMHAYIKEIPGRIEFTVEFDGRTAKDVRQRMDEVMATRGEGLVIKHPDSEYVLNGRNRDWIKVKPEYMDNMGETVDVLVVSGNYGSGKRGGGVSTLICAVLDDRRQDEDNDEPKYSTFVRIGSGLSFADYAWVRDKPWKEWDPKEPPSFLLTSKKGSEDQGDLYLEPKDSFILKVKAAEIIATDQYHLGFTMRFPRALDIREDLMIDDCMTASAVLDSIRSDKKRKMESNTDVTKKKRKIVKKLEVLPGYTGPKLKSVPVISDLFSEKVFVVASDPKSRTGDQDRVELMTSIYSHGGSCLQIASNQPSLLVIYGGKTTPYDIQLLINKGTFDIIKPQWIHDCISSESLVPLKKRYFFHATANRQQSEEYGLEDEDEDENDTVNRSTASKEQPSTQSQNKDEEVNVDPLLAGWLQVNEDGTGNTEQEGAIADGSDTETDNDSDNEDVKPNAEELDQDWTDVVVPSGSGQSSLTLSSNEGDAVKESGSAVRMGEDNDAMEYDQNAIFKHLSFYLDTPENARKIGMVATSRYESDITRKFETLSKLVTENGGRIVVDLEEPSLTHVVVDKRDVSRRLELITRTSKPKRRRLVISEFIQACLDEETLLDEEEFAP